MPITTQRKTFVFLHDQYADWELGFILPELLQNKKSVTTFGLNPSPVRSMGGLLVTPDSSIEQVKLVDAEALILPGGMFWKSFSSPALDKLVKEARRLDLIVGAICDATGYLAQLGILDKVDHSSNGLEFLQERAPNYRGHAFYKNTPATRSGKLVTADGYGAMDFCMKLAELYGIYTPEIREQWLRANKSGKWQD